MKFVLLSGFKHKHWLCDKHNYKYTFFNMEFMKRVCGCNHKFHTNDHFFKILYVNYMYISGLFVHLGHHGLRFESPDCSLVVSYGSIFVVACI